RRAGKRGSAKAVSLGIQRSGDDQGDYERMKHRVQDEMKQHFRPEFLNRIDDTIVFHQLTEDEIVRIVDMMLARVDVQMKNKDMSLEVTDAGKKLLAKRGYDPVLGARPLRRSIQREVEDPLSEKILFGELQPGQIVVVDVALDDNREPTGLTFRGEPKPVAVPDAVPANIADTGLAN